MTHHHHPESVARGAVAALRSFGAMLNPIATVRTPDARSVSDRLRGDWERLGADMHRGEGKAMRRVAADTDA
jgi:hypothetical protein